jgi:hypothetical protein
MERYTIEDIELIRRKSGINYEEAVNLLEYHNGNLTKALVDLERNGRIREREQKESHSPYPQHDGKEKAMNFIQKLYSTRFVVRKHDISIVNLSLLFMIPFALIFHNAAFLCLILIFVFGYRIRIDKKAQGFCAVKLDKMVKNAAQNVKETFDDLAKEFTDGTKKAPEPEENDRSYYQPSQSATAPADQTASAPHADTTPVIVHCNEDGNVNVSRDQDGYTSASVE